MLSLLIRYCVLNTNLLCKGKVSSLTELDSVMLENLLLFVHCKATEFKPVKLETVNVLLIQPNIKAQQLEKRQIVRLNSNNNDLLTY